MTKESKSVSSRSIAKHMGIRPPTVYRLLEALVDDNMIIKEKYGKVELSEEGSKAAKAYRVRIGIMQEVLMNRLGLDHESGRKAAFYFASSMDLKSQRSILSIADKKREGEDNT